MPPKRILVVDDDLSILLLVATLLRRESYEVDTAGGGRDALLKIELTPYDVIVLDLMMPEVNGVDVLIALHRRVPHVKCVVILSAASSFDVARASNPNVFAALRKPFELAELISTVRDCIEAPCDPADPLPLLPATAAA